MLKLSVASAGMSSLVQEGWRQLPALGRSVDTLPALLLSPGWGGFTWCAKCQCTHRAEVVYSHSRLCKDGGKEVIHKASTPYTVTGKQFIPFRFTYLVSKVLSPNFYSGSRLSTAVSIGLKFPCFELKVQCSFILQHMQKCVCGGGKSFWSEIESVVAISPCCLTFSPVTEDLC